MKTEVCMKREIFGKEISQKSKSEFFSATDLCKAGNAKRWSDGRQPFEMSEWFRQKSTIDFIKQLESKYGVVKISGRGRGKHTWVHPYLFIDMALAIDPDLKIQVYEWLFDKLIQYRNDSGDTYKKMAGYLYTNCSNKSEFHSYIREVANKIKEKCNVDDWQEATEKQLELRNEIHKNIALLCDVLRDNDRAVELGIAKTERITNA